MDSSQAIIFQQKSHKLPMVIEREINMKTSVGRVAFHICALLGFKAARGSLQLKGGSSPALLIGNYHNHDSTFVNDRATCISYMHKKQ